MLIVECIPFKGFKEKIAITKKYSNCKCEIIKREPSYTVGGTVG